jgi:hypothetical protein
VTVIIIRPTVLVEVVPVPAALAEGRPVPQVRGKEAPVQAGLVAGPAAPVPVACGLAVDPVGVALVAWDPVEGAAEVASVVMVCTAFQVESASSRRRFKVKAANLEECSESE